MASTRHEVLVQLLREARGMVEALLHVANREIPPHDSVTALTESLGNALPLELKADVVLRFERRKRPVLAAITEVQLRPDEDKRYSWPLYVASLAYRLRCRVVLLVVTPDARVAKWARSVDVGSGLAVLGPDEVPFVSAEDARHNLGLALASAVVHGHDRDAQRAGQNAMNAIRAARAALKREEYLGYSDLIMASLTEAARKAIPMFAKDRLYFHPDLRKSQLKGREEGLAKGRQEGIFALVAARKLKLSAAQRKHIRATGDVKQLERWLRLARTATSAAELFPS